MDQNEQKLGGGELMQEMENEWQKSLPKTDQLLGMGAEAFFNSIDGIKRAFEPTKQVAVCMDERLPSHSIRLAGSGILMPKEELLETFRKAGIKGITTHAGCGAAAIAVKNAESDLPAEEFAKQWANNISRELDIPYLGHLTELDGPENFHNATAIYYTGVMFSNAGINELPQGFVITRHLSKSLVSDVDLALQIAFGHHGFGEKFGAEREKGQRPMTIVILGDPKNPSLSFDALRAEVEPIAKAHGDRVRIDGFNV